MKKIKKPAFMKKDNANSTKVKPLKSKKAKKK